MATNATSARRGRKTVTVVFADVTGSTALGEKVDPETLQAVLARYFDEMRAVIERHGGTVEKFIGDAVMAVFGVPSVHEDDATRAVRAAAEMRDAMFDLNRELDLRYGATLAARIGVNTGEVVAGDPGTGQSFATGDGVQLAARLEQSAEPGEILLGESTYRLVRDLVDAAAVAPLTLKGKSKPVAAWRLLGLADEGTDRRDDARFVGRVAELGALAECLDRAIESSSCVLVTLVGEPGVGKSRLVRELSAANAHRARFVVGRCLPYGEGITYWPLAEILEDVAGDDASSLRQLIEEGSIEETQWASRKLFEALARSRPLVVVLDDVHWAEPTFLDLVEYVAAFSRGAPILLLCLTRPDLLETRPSWTNQRGDATVLTLDPLSQEEASSLAEDLAPGLSHDERRRALDTAEGNPLFVEHLLAFFVETGTDAAGIPPSLDALLAARIDALEPSEREAIECAAIEGRVFHRGAVAALVRDDELPTLSASLLGLVRKGLVRPARSHLSGDDAFRFAHILVRDAAYAGILKRRRIELHREFAEWLAPQEDGPHERDEMLGYHFERAYRYRLEVLSADDETAALGMRAATHLGPAGDRALARGDVAAAANLLDRATGMIEEPGAVRADMLASLGMARAATGELEAAQRILAEAVELADAVGDSRTRERAAVEAARIGLITGELGADAARAAATEAIAVLEALDDDLGLAKAWLLLVFVHNWHLEFSGLERAASKAQFHARRAGATRDAADALAWTGPAIVFGPRPVPDSIAYIEGIALDAPGPLTEAGTLLTLGCLRLMNGEPELGRDLYRRSEAVYRDIGMRLFAAAQATLTGWSELVAGDAATAEALLRTGYTELEEMGERSFLSSTAAQLARVLCESGRYNEADALRRTAEELSGEDDLFNAILLAGVGARVCASRGELDEAMRAAEHAVARAGDADCLELSADAYVTLAEVMHSAGRSTVAADARTHALRLYELKHNVVAAGRARSNLSVV
jgi:class 3 adenylate cyclase/tetratricopeptide (TPR) repeat protein